MEQLYALIHPVTNKIVQFSEFKNDNFKIVDIEFINNQRTVSEYIALCVPVTFTPELRNKTYDPITNSFLD